MSFRFDKLLLLPLLALLAVSCYIESPGKPAGVHYIDWPQPPYFPTANNIPANNRLSTEGVLLGRYLFYDYRIGGKRDADSLLSCAFCHKQEYGFDAGADNNRLGNGGMRGAAGLYTAHVPLPLVNVAYNIRGLGWTSSLEYPQGTLETLIANTLLDSAEFAASKEDIVDRVASIEMYPPLFNAAFGTPTVTFDRICMALAQFVRSLVSSQSKFDRYVRGELQLSDKEMKGYVLFTTEEGADCFHCHGGNGNMLFTTYDNLSNGLDAPEHFTDPHDRFSVTGKEADRGAYRVPTLRNIAYTAPYMHDGRFSTLDEVIDQYSENVQYSPCISPLMHHVKAGGVQLTEGEKECLKAFLLTLGDEAFINNPEFSDPFVQDTLLP
ncbi:MAG: hypothetical protein NC324_06725 [Bacteroides sp.]|nr:hypothetical protein [Bacteroides sp.]